MQVILISRLQAIIQRVKALNAATFNTCFTIQCDKANIKMFALNQSHRFLELRCHIIRRLEGIHFIILLLDRRLLGIAFHASNESAEPRSQNKANQTRGASYSHEAVRLPRAQCNLESRWFGLSCTNIGQLLLSYSQSCHWQRCDGGGL